ncbi:MAG: RsmB/NOP family class I SAM-dependent RNA methyltransferase [Bacteroidetes bacterium]|nr:RsmB/NOP family class I SAM-dependent RNA methyltransferase [Bacteroidota bacterium]
MPLAEYLKNYFRSNKKYGSRDRKFISELLYGVYRLGKLNDFLSLRNRMLIGAFLGGRLPKLFFEKSGFELSELYDKTFDEKREEVESYFKCNFSLLFSLSKEITTEHFIRNLYSEPRIFIRVRKNIDEVKKILTKNNIAFEIYGTNCFALQNKVNLETLLAPEDYVIQDYASQSTGEFLFPRKGETWWDCCAASGGKSIMLLDKCKSVKLQVSDIRSSILANLKQRMKRYGYDDFYRASVVDASKDSGSNTIQSFDHILCDAPCSGSGTWARSPENFYFFNEEKLKEFAKLQKSILLNLLLNVKPNTSLVYITCSVFVAENEEVIYDVMKLTTHFSVTTEIINAYTKGGDAMFVAVFKNSNDRILNRA